MNLWLATENEIVDHFEVACNEFQPCRGYDVIKLDIAKLTSVSKAVTVYLATLSHNLLYTIIPTVIQPEPRVWMDITV